MRSRERKVTPVSPQKLSATELRGIRGGEAPVLPVSPQDSAEQGPELNLGPIPNPLG